MPNLTETIHDLAPQLYDEQRNLMGLARGTDMSHSNQCQPMTLAMTEALVNRGLPVKREHHLEQTRGCWHYVLNHSLGDEPTQDDLITDLNPWQWTTQPRYTGLLHAPRNEVMARIREAGAPDYFVALRGIHTIVDRNKTRF